MPSRRALLAAITLPLAGCAGGPVLSVPAVEDQSCPPVDLHATRTVCSHTDEQGGIDVSTSATTFSTERESLETLSLRIENNTGHPLELRPRRWRLFRNRGWGWNERKLDYLSDGNLDEIEAGGSFGWYGVDALLKLDATGPTPVGLYAAVMSVGAGGEHVACVFLFRVVHQE